MSDKKNPAEWIEDEDGYLRRKPAKPEKPKNKGSFALLVLFAVLIMIAIANLPPRNATQPIPPQSIR